MSGMYKYYLSYSFLLIAFDTSIYGEHVTDSGSSYVLRKKIHKLNFSIVIGVYLLHIQRALIAAKS